MRYGQLLAVAVLCGAWMGCESDQPKESPAPQPSAREVNTALINSFKDTSIRNAIIVQHTLYPYHFVADSAMLNELGQKELAVLLDHMLQTDPNGRLTVRQGGTPRELYEARLRTVHQAIADAGIDKERIRLSEGGMVGGEGMPSYLLPGLIEERNSPTDPLYYPIEGGDSSGSTGTSGTSGGSSSRSR